jgi:hypothetical protein
LFYAYASLKPVAIRLREVIRKYGAGMSFTKGLQAKDTLEVHMKTAVPCLWQASENDWNKFSALMNKEIIASVSWCSGVDATKLYFTCDTFVT